MAVNIERASAHTFIPTFFAAEQVKIMKSNLQNWGADNILSHSASQSKKGQKHMFSPIEFEKCW